MNRNNFRWIAPIIFLLIIGCFYIVVIKSLPLAEYFFKLSPDKEHDALDIASRFGESSGFINALFSALAFGGVLLTFYWQFMVDGKQHKATLQSQFENVFFNMTNTLENIVDNLTAKASADADIGEKISALYPSPNTASGNCNVVVKGRDVFEVWFEVFRNKAKDRNDKVTVFKELMKGSLDHYFRYLYRILVYIDQSKLIDDEEKYEYAAILRAQLSEYELLIIFFNGLSVYGKQKAKPLFEKYSMFNNIRKDKLEDLGGIDKYKQGDTQPSSNLTYNKNAFEHSYDKKFSCMKFFGKIVLVTVVLAALYELFDDFWLDYVTDMFLSKIPNDSICIDILCIIAIVYAYINKYCNKKRYNKQMLEKIYGSTDKIGKKKYLPYNSLLNHDFNFISISVIILLLYVSCFAESCDLWIWTGEPIAYVWYLAAYLVSDFIISFFFTGLVGINVENIRDWKTCFIMNKYESLQACWNDMRQRYDYIKKKKEGTLDDGYASNFGASKEENTAKGECEQNVEEKEVPDNVEPIIEEQEEIISVEPDGDGGGTDGEAETVEKSEDNAGDVETDKKDVDCEN